MKKSVLLSILTLGVVALGFLSMLWADAQAAGALPRTTTQTFSSNGLSVRKASGYQAPTTNVGTVEVYRVLSGAGTVIAYEIDWEGSADGNIVATLPDMSGALLNVVTHPSATAAPADNYDVYLFDQSGLDLLDPDDTITTATAGQGMNRSSTLPQRIIPFQTDVNGIPSGVIVMAGTLTLHIDDASTGSGTIRLLVR